jgi:hypothetical protein
MDARIGQVDVLEHRGVGRRAGATHRLLADEVAVAVVEGATE